MVVLLFTVIDISATKETLYFEICKENILFLSQSNFPPATYEITLRMHYHIIS